MQAAPQADAEEAAVLDAPPKSEADVREPPNPHKRLRSQPTAAEESSDDDDEEAGAAVVKRSAAAKHALSVAASAQIAAIRREQVKSQRARLKFLLGQSEIFAHFIHNLDGPLAPVADSAGAVEPAASFSSPRAGGAAGVGAEIGEALLLSPIRAAAAAQHKDAAVADASLKAVSAAPPSSPPLSVRRTRSSESAAPAAAAPAAGAGEVGKGRKRSRAAKGAKGGDQDADAAEDGGADGEFLVRPATRLQRQPTSIKGTMRDYQLEGLNWMISLHENGLNGILADEMGLGKTLQSISLLAYTQEYLGSDGPHLVLVPKSTLGNWITEFGRFCPSLKVLKLHGDKDERSETIKAMLHPGMTAAERGWHVCITTYEVAVIEKGPLARLPWQYLVIDEAHRIKNENSALASVVRTFTTAHRLLITGTPLQNNLHELWALLNFLLPDVFGSAAAFDSWFNLASDAADEAAKEATVKQLHRVLKPFMLRRLKSDVAKSLPPKTETLLYVGMSSVQRELYRSILMRDVDAVLNTGSGGGTTRLSNLLMHLRKACNHPYIFDGVEDRTLDPMGEHVVTASAKLMLLDKLLPRLRSQGSRVLIFSQMTSVLDILEDYCRMRAYEYSRIDGSCNYDDREEAIDSFNRPGSSKFIFLLSTRAGGLGINLATADVVILHDSDWNPQVDLQAQDRAHRIGQTKPVQVYRLVTTGSVEEKMVERAMLKLKLDAVVVQQGRLADANKGMSKEDMLEMIRFGADAVFKGSGAEVTDADIDSILEMGRSKTQAMNSAIDKRAGAAAGGGGRGLLDFKLDGGFSTQTFEGVDFSDAAARAKEKESLDALRTAALASFEPTEVRKGKYIAPAADTDVAGGVPKPVKNTEANRMKLLPPAHRPPAVMHPWMLFDAARINAISNDEYDHIVRSREAAAAATPADAASIEEGPAAGGASFSPFPEALIKEREALMKEGFPKWKKSDCDNYLQACASLGRTSPDVPSVAAKRVKHPIAEVKRYHALFWTRGPLLFDPAKWSKIVSAVERGEGLLKESEIACAALAIRLARTLPTYNPPPWLLAPRLQQQQPGAAVRTAANTQTAPSVAELTGLLDSGVPFATNPWRYIPHSYASGGPWSTTSVAAPPRPPKFVAIAAAAKSGGSSAAAVVSPFSACAPTALPHIAWTAPPPAAASKVAVVPLASSAPAPAAAAAPLTITSVLSQKLTAHKPLAEHAALSLNRGGYAASNDAFLLAAILHRGGIGACSFELIAEDIRNDPAHVLDAFFRSRSPMQLEARAKVLLKTVLRDIVDVQRRADKAVADEARQALKKRSTTLTRVAEELAHAIFLQDQIDALSSKGVKLPRKPSLGGESDIDDPMSGPVSARGAAAAVPDDDDGHGDGAVAHAGASRKVVPDALISALVRTIVAAGKTGIDRLVTDFIDGDELKSYVELAASTAAVAAGGVIDAAAVAASAEKLKPSKNQVKHYIGQLAHKGEGSSTDLTTGRWRLRDEFAQLARLSDADAAAWIAAHPISPMLAKPRPKKADAPAAELPAADAPAPATGVVDLTAEGVAAAAPASAATDDVDSTPELPPGPLAALAFIVSHAGGVGVDKIVEDLLAYPAAACRSVSKAAVKRDLKKIGVKDRAGPSGSLVWRVLPSHAALLDLPRPPPEPALVAASAADAAGASAEAAGVAPASDAPTGDAAPAAGAASATSTGNAGGTSPAGSTGSGSLLGLAGAAKPRVSL